MFSGLKKGLLPDTSGLILPSLDDVTENLPSARATVDWSLSIAGYSMLGNNYAGCCTYAAAANARMQFGIYSGQAPMPTEAEVIKEYSTDTGYVVGNPDTDHGQIEAVLLKNWMTRGFTFGDKLDKIEGFALVDVKSIDKIKQAIDCFGGVFVSVDLPLSAESQGLLWTVTSGADGAPGSAGGHEMWYNAYDQYGLQSITWAEKVRMGWDWWLKYASDAHVALSRDWVLPNGRSPAGVRYDILSNAMASLGTVGQ